MKPTEATLCFLRKGDEVLLAEKQRKIGAGRLNGFGGRQELGETIEQAMIREAREEGGFTPTVYKKMAEILFHNPSDDEILKNMQVHAYIATAWAGEITETDEMKTPRWFKISEVPYEQLFEADRGWLKQILGGVAVKGEVFYNQDWSVKSSNIYSIDGFDP